MLEPPPASRDRLATILKAAYGDGLLSENTYVHRIDRLLSDRVIDPAGLVGDITLRAPRRVWSKLLDLALGVAWRRELTERNPPLTLALDWSGATDEMLIGRHPSCDVVLGNPAVSRRHACVTFRDGIWVLQDLESTNGTTINGLRVGRCQLRVGDHLMLGEQHLVVD
jgi:hypothetical protein